MATFTFLFGILLLYSNILTSNSEVTITTNPTTNVTITEGQIDTVNCTFTCTHSHPITVHMSLSLNRHAEIQGQSSFRLPTGSECRRNDTFVVNIKAHRVGREKLRFRNESGYNVRDEFDVAILRHRGIVTTIFQVTLVCMLMIMNVGFGCEMHWDVIKEIWRRPFAPIIGICCQYIVMPLLGYGLARAMPMSDAYKVGMFVVACCPGGSSSNTWSRLLEGDLHLSITMTMFSMTLSLALMPFWLWALGRSLVARPIEVPFDSIILALAALVIPLLLGILLGKWKRKIADFISKLVKPYCFLFVLYLVTFGIYENRYVFPMLGDFPVVIPIAMTLPYSGYILGFIIANIFRQPLYRALTISIETGMQNAAIALVILWNFYEMPDGDVAALVPVIAFAFQATPFWVLLIIKTIRNGGCGEHDKLEFKDKSDIVDLEKDTDATKDKESKIKPLDMTPTKY